MKTELLKETTLYVSDLGVAERFYINIVGLTVTERETDQQVLLQYENYALFLFQTPPRLLEDKGDNSETNKFGQVSFGISPADLSSWRKRLQNHGVSIDEEEIWPNGSQSIWFRDPSGNRIQLTTQMQDLEESSIEEQSQQVNSGGFMAKWKLYDAANKGMRKGSS